MTTRVLIIGAGLSSGLLVDRLQQRADVELTVLEGGDAPGGNHTWCFHDTDVSGATLQWLKPFTSKSWRDHDVAFPSFTRTLSGEYFAIRSHDFAKRVTQRLGSKLRTRTRARDVTATTVTLESGEKLDADLIIDARGTQSDTNSGFQKFLGREVLLEKPHGLTRPLLMDASVKQLDGFRFIYVLPWDERRVLIEDTRYADTADIDAPAFRSEIDAFLTARGWKIEAVEREELAALPIPFAGNAPSFSRPVIGVSGGFFHATTGYSVPFAADIAERIASLPTLDAHALTTLLNARARDHWHEMGFFRLLNRMLFKGAEPAERVKVFESFYRHSPELIARFYAGKLTWADKLIALRRGAPTVPAFRAMKAAWGS
ncbi:MAG: lycopene beta-cyclase CrtY [Archangium sp.]|nr:lycopene beta-cyclase CrtY [Archangium sp.]